MLLGVVYVTELLLCLAYPIYATVMHKYSDIALTCAADDYLCLLDWQISLLKYSLDSIVSRHTGRTELFDAIFDIPCK